MRNTSNARERRAPRRPGSWIAALGLALGAAGCGGALDDALDIKTPGTVEAGGLDSPANARLLVESTVAAFECAFDDYIVVGGLIGDELTDSQQTADQWDYDRRTIAPHQTPYGSTTCANRIGVYTPLSTARWLADNTLAKLKGWSDQEVSNRQLQIATVAAYGGYATLLIGEGFCTASFDVEGKPGPELTREQVFQRAEARFTEAIAAAAAASNTDLRNMALIGRARTRLNLGKKAEAAADARLVPEGYVRNANYTAAEARAENRVYAHIARGRFASVDTLYRGLTYAGQPDPRVRVRNTGQRGVDQRTIIWTAEKYPNENARIPIARWAEGALIQAEAAVAAGDLAGAVTLINRVHALSGIAPFTGTGAAAITAQIIEDRRRELFLESHRLGDMIRYNLPFFPVTGQTYKQGGLVGDTKCMPLPDVERLNNPALRG